MTAASHAVLWMLLPLVAVLPAAGRTWTDVGGNAIEAEWVGVKGDTIILERDGVRRTFRLSQLSHEDRRYVDRELKNREQAERKARLEAFRFKVDPDARMPEHVLGSSDGLYPKSREAIFKRLTEVLGAHADAGMPPEHVKALNELNAYRYLCGLPSDVGLNETYTKKAQAAAEICRRIGRLDHNPPNPGMPEEAYAIAREGAGHSNLHQGRGLAGAVSSFMDDSDISNIDRVGHRRWCLNPSMALTGFGQDAGYSAMWSMDASRSRKDIPDFDFIAFPPRGYMPVEFFRGHYAWSLSLNPAHYAIPTALEREQVKVYPVTRSGDPGDPETWSEALELNAFHLDRGGYAIANCIIFRPEGIQVKRGNRYWVEISGLEDDKGKKTSIGYLVEFTSR